MIELKKVISIEDMALVKTMAYKIFPEVYAGYVREQHVEYYLDKNQRVKAIQKQISEGFEYFLILEAEIVIGYIGIHEVDEKLILSKLYIYADKRGAGKGEYIMNWIQKKAIENKLNLIELSVLKQNKKAIRFYENMGYEISDRFTHIFYTGYEEINYKMIKKIE